MTQLSESIGNLVQLQYLNLSNNQLIQLPESIGNLEYIQLQNLKVITNLIHLH